MFKLLCLGVLLTAYAPLALADGNNETQKEAPLKTFTDVVKNFKTTALCDHDCAAKTWTDDSGCLYVTFETEMKSNDTARKLCDCMYNYINQNNWLEGATAKCEKKCKKLKLVLEGKPDPNYDPNAPPPPPQGPLRDLGDVLEKFPTCELGGCQCRPVVSEDEFGCVSIDIECDLKPTSKPYQGVCKDILSYLNQNNWLDKSTNKCSPVADGTKKFVLSLKGNTEATVATEVPTK